MSEQLVTLYLNVNTNHIYVEDDQGKSWEIADSDGILSLNKATRKLVDRALAELIKEANEGE